MGFDVFIYMCVVSGVSVLEIECVVVWKKNVIIHSISSTLSFEPRIPFTSNGRLATSVTGGPGEPVDFAVNPKGGEDRYP